MGRMIGGEGGGGLFNGIVRLSVAYRTVQQANRMQSILALWRAIISKLLGMELGSEKYSHQLELQGCLNGGDFDLFMSDGKRLRSHAQAGCTVYTYPI